MKKIKINFQAAKSSDTMVVIMAYINYGYTADKSQEIEIRPAFKIAVGETYRQALTHSMEARLKVSLKNLKNPQMKIKGWRNEVMIKKTYKPCIVSTGVSLPEAFWDKKTKRATGTYLHKNELLKAFKSNVEILYESLAKVPGIDLSPKEFKKLVVKHIVKVKGGNISFLQGKQLKIFPDLEQAEEMKITTPRWVDYLEERNEAEKNSEEIGDSSYKHNKVFIEHFKKFEKERVEKLENKRADSSNKASEREKKVYCQDLNSKLFEDFFIWFRRQPKINEESTIDKAKVIFKKFAFQAKDDFKLHDLTVSNNRKLKKRAGGKAFKKPIHYLTVQELDQIEKLTTAQLAFLDSTNENNKSKTRSSHELVRDYFLLQSWNGGERISDYSKFTLIERPDKPGSFYHDNISKKTDTYTKLACFPIVIKIWKKYAKKINGKFYGVLPPPPTSQEFNRMLKRICRLGKINELVLINKSGERKIKWSIMKSHCARKSFINNMVYEYNANPLNVADWAGISIQELYKSYLGADTRKMFKEFEELVERSQSQTTK